MSIVGTSGNRRAENTATATATIGFITLSTSVPVVIGTVVFQNRMAREVSHLVSALGVQLSREVSGSAMANIEVINSLPLDPKRLARQAIHESLQLVWIMVNFGSHSKKRDAK